MKPLICALTAFPAFCMAVPAALALSGPGRVPALPQAAHRARRPAQATAGAFRLDGELFYQLLLGEINARGGEPAAGFALILDAARKTNDAAAVPAGRRHRAAVALR